MTGEIFKIGLQILQVLNIHSCPVSACIAIMMQGFLTLRNHLCNISNFIVPDFVKLKSGFPSHVSCSCCYNILSAVSCLNHLPEPCIAVLLEQCSDFAELTEMSFDQYWSSTLLEG